jgi:hypothetical protein
MSLSRRTVLKSSAAVTALSMLGGVAQKTHASSPAFKPGPGNKWPGRVVVNFNKNAVTGSASSLKIEDTVPPEMIKESVLALAQKGDIGEAWKAIFPDTLTAASKIAIKTNFYTTNLCCVHWSVVKAITDGLQLMDFGGTKFPAANITVYESNTPATSTFVKVGYTAERFPGISLVMDSQQSYSDAATNETKYCTSLNKADFLINIFGIRGHQDYCEGVTLGFKSHWGTYPADFNKHTAGTFSIRCAHMMCSGVVNKKLVLSVAAGLVSNNMGVNHSPTDGPDDYSTYAKKMDSTATTLGACTIIMSTDPISADMQAIKVMKLNANKAYNVSDMPKYLRACAGDSSALSGTVYNIGVIDESKMTVITFKNGEDVSPVAVRENPAQPASEYPLRVSPHHGQGGIVIEYAVPSSLLGSRSLLSVYDARGKLVFSKEQKVNGANNRFTWDGTAKQGKKIGRGRYVCQLIAGKHRRSAAFYFE